MRIAAAAAVPLALTVLAATSVAQTTQRTIVRGGPLHPAMPAFVAPAPGPGARHVTRQLPIAKAQARRSLRRRSLAYFGILTDFQLADEESPARVELFDPQFGSSSWRPHEALLPAVIDQAARRISALAEASPVAAAGGSRARMDFAVLPGDEADNQQLNEVRWVRQLIEGGTPLDPNSGTSDYSSCGFFDKAALGGRPADEAERYTGVQDHDDYNAGSGNPLFYDPDEPKGVYAGWPRYPGLMDRAQLPFMPHGVRRGSSAARVPTYVANGNHDLAVQGNDIADDVAEQIATGCHKPFSGSVSQAALPRSAFRMSQGFAVPPDPGRRFVDRVELKQVYSAGVQADDHGFAFVDRSENAASGFTAGYYAWTPRPGIRMISLDTVAEGGAASGSAQGNIDEPQFRWLVAQLAAARRARELVVAFGHHPLRSMTVAVPDEVAPTCSGRYLSENGPYSGSKDGHGHDTDPGCDLDPRGSAPVHTGPELRALFNANPHFVAYAAGHVHANRVLPCAASRCPRTGNWWEISTAATADWPQQQRLLELMDNADGTVSLISTLVDHGAPVSPPPPGSSPGAFGEAELASAGRAFALNDPHVNLSAPGAARDGNVELIVRDPRQGRGAGLCAVAAAKAPRGKALDRARLGRKRSTIRRAYPRPSLRKGRYLDRFCLVGGGFVRAQVPSYRLLLGLSNRERARVRNRAVMIRSSRRGTRIRGIAVRSSIRTVRRRLRGERSYRIGSTRWYLARVRGARIAVATRRGRVTEIGIADLRLTATKKRAQAFLRSL